MSKASCFNLFMTILFMSRLLSGGTIFPSGTKVTKIGGEFRFTEGSCWRNSGYFVFSDISSDKIYRYTPNQGVQVFLAPSYNTNGIVEDKDGNLLLAQQGARQLVRLKTDNTTQTILASSYNGKKLKSPNDIAVRSDGMIFFTDPPYGIRTDQQELGFCGVFRIGKDSVPVLLIDSLKKPNGIVFSPDESLLYIGDTDSARVIVCSVNVNGTFSNVHVFIRLGVPRYVDGLTVDLAGNLYCAGTENWIWVFSPGGILIDSLNIPGKTSNLEWGGLVGNSLLITSGVSVYEVTLPTVRILNRKFGPVNDQTKTLAYLHKEIFFSEKNSNDKFYYTPQPFRMGKYWYTIDGRSSQGQQRSHTGIYLRMVAYHPGY